MKQGFDFYSNVIYLGAIFLSIVLASFYNNQRIKHLINSKILRTIIIVSPMSLIIGLRSIDVGYDTYMYVHYFYGRLEALPDNEFVFSTIVRLLHYLTEGQNYSVMLLFFTYASIFLFVYAIESMNLENDLTITVLAYALVFGLCLTDQFRQLLAVSLFAYAISLYINKKNVKAVIITLIGYGVHNTIILAGLLFVACSVIEKTKQTNIRIKIKSNYGYRLKINKIGLLFVCVAMIVVFLFYSSPGFLALVAAIMPSDYSSYFTTRVNYETIGLGLLLDTMPIIPLLLLRNYIKTSYERTMFLFSLFVPLFRVCGYVSYFLYRMLYYPEIVAFILYAILFKKENVPKKWKYMLIFICLVYFYFNYMLMNNHGAYPYKFCVNPSRF